MKVLLINGSPHKKGNTYIALSEVATALEKEGVATEIVSIGTKAIQGCIACNKCQETGVCVFNDEPYRTIREKLQQADGVIIVSPVYFAVRHCSTNQPLLSPFADAEGQVQLSTA